MRYVLILILSVIFFYMNGVSMVYAENEEEKNEYDFNESEFEKKPFTFSGYVELFPSLYIADRQSALYRLKYYKEGPGNPNADAYLRIQPEATFEKGIFKAFIRAYETFGYSNHQWPFDLRLYEGYITLKPNQHIIIDAGKKTLKWGKGYAWNPVAFIDRPKNPDDPDLSYEGYTVASADFIASFTGPLKTISFTPVVLPVYNKLNDSFGKSGHWNFAGRLYLLFYDTDIDFIFIAGTNKISKYGIDLSRNITTSFEIHGECAVIPGYKKRHLSDIGLMRERTITAVSALAGIRYLTEIETTIILEYYYNGSGMSNSEMFNYYNFIDTAYYSYRASKKNEILFKYASGISEGGYGRINPMKNYLYFRVSQKEPFNILYFTPAITVLFNIDDISFTMTPELLYTGVNNLELRFRYSFLWGGKNTEFGEKPADHRCDLRVRYYF